MSKQQRFFFRKINPRLAITIIIILALFVGTETYWLSKSVSTLESNKGTLPHEKQATPLSEKDARLLEKEAIIQALLREDARKSREEIHKCKEILKNPDEILDIQRWATYRDSLYGFEYKYPQVLKRCFGVVSVSIEPDKLDPTNIEYDGVKIKNPLLMKVGARDWYSEQYSDYPYSRTCGVSVYQTGLDNKHHLTFVFGLCNLQERLVPGELTLREKIISKIFSTFTFAFSEEELSNWKKYSYTTYGTSFTFEYPRTYTVKVGGEGFVRVGEDNKIIVFPPGSEDNPYVHIMIGFLPFNKPEEFSIVAGAKKLHYDQNTNQWIVDGSSICGKLDGYFGTQNIPYYYVGSGKTDHPSEYVVVLPQGLLYFSGSNHIEVGLDDILSTFTLDHPESVIKARCD